MRGAIRLLPNTPSWCSAQLKKKAREQLWLCLYPGEDRAVYISVKKRSKFDETRNITDVKEFALLLHMEPE
jgi:hypothetical protein